VGIGLGKGKSKKRRGNKAPGATYMECAVKKKGIQAKIFTSEMETDRGKNTEKLLFLEEIKHQKRKGRKERRKKKGGIFAKSETKG